MIYDPTLVDRIRGVKTEDTDSVGGAANVTPSYILSEVSHIDDVTNISSDVISIDFTPSTPSNSGSADTEPGNLLPMKNRRGELSNYIFNTPSGEFRELYQQKIADRFIYGGDVVNAVSPEDISLFESDASFNVFSEFGEIPTAPMSGDERVDSIDTYVDPSDPDVINLLQTLKDQGVITDGMTSDDITAAVFNYITDHFQYMSDVGGDNWSTVGDTVRRGGGDCEDLSFLLASLTMAALIDSGMGYDDANSRVRGVAVNLDGGTGHIFITYTSDDGTLRVLDPSLMRDGLADIESAPAYDPSSSDVLFVFNDLSVGVIDQNYDYSLFAPSVGETPITGYTVIDTTPKPTSTTSVWGSAWGTNTPPPVDTIGPVVTNILSTLARQGILTTGMTADQVATAVFNYLLSIYSSFAGDFTTTSTGWGAFNSSSFDETALNTAFERILEAALKQYAGVGASAVTTLVNVVRGSDNSIYITYTDQNGITRMLDLTRLNSISSINEAPPANPAGAIDPSDPRVQNVLNTLISNGTITADMTATEIGAAIVDYMNANQAGMDQNTLSFFTAALMIAAFNELGKPDAAARVGSMGVRLPSGEVKVYVTFKCDNGDLKMLDPSTMNGLTDLHEATMPTGTYRLLFVVGGGNLYLYNLTVRDNTGWFSWRNIGPNADGVEDTVKFYTDGSWRVFTGNWATDYGWPPADYTSYITDVNPWTPSGLSSLDNLYAMAGAIDDEFNSILEHYNTNDFWTWGPHGFQIPNEGRIMALSDKIQKLTNLFLVLQLIHKGRINLVGVVKQEMEDVKGYQGMDTGKIVSKACQSVSAIINKLNQKLLEKIQQYNEARYQHLLREAHEHNDSSWDKFKDALSFGANTRKELQETKDATDAFMKATQADLRALQSITDNGVNERSADDDPTSLDGAFNQLNQELDRQIDESLGRVDGAIRHGDNGYVWIDNDSLMRQRDDIIGAMNMMRAFLLVATSDIDMREIVHEEMAGVSGYKSDKNSIFQSFENKFATLLGNYDRLVSQANLYTQLRNQSRYLEIQLNKITSNPTGAGIGAGIGTIIGVAIGSLLGPLGAIAGGIIGFAIGGAIGGGNFVGSLNSMCQFLGAALGWILIIGPLFNFMAAGTQAWANEYYDDEMHIPASQYNSRDTRTSTGDAAYDALNSLNYLENQAISGANSSLLISADDGLLQIDYVSAAMLMDMLTGYQNMERLITGLDRRMSTNRNIVHQEMTNIGGLDRSQVALAAQEAKFDDQLADFNSMISNLMMRKQAENLERQQDLQTQRMLTQAAINLFNIIPGLGGFISAPWNLAVAKNDPAYHMSAPSSNNPSYFGPNSSSSSSSTPEQQIAAQSQALFSQMISNGLVSAGGATSSLGVNPQVERNLKDRIQKLSNMMQILYLLGKAKLEAHSIVHQEMTGVKTSVPGELSEAGLEADFQRMMEVLNYLIKWCEEIIEVDDRADTQAQVVSRQQQYLVLNMVMSTLECLLIALDIVAGIFTGGAAVPAITAIIIALEVIKAITSFVYTMIVEKKLLDEMERGGYGDLTTPMSDNSSTQRDILNGGEDVVFDSINDDLISQLGGGGSYVNEGYRAQANRRIDQIFNVRRMLANLTKAMQDMRNQVHTQMAGVGGRETAAALAAFNHEEQVARSIIDGLFRTLERMAARANMIHEAEIQYWTNVIQAIVSVVVSLVCAALKVELQIKSQSLKSMQADLAAKETQLAAVGKTSKMTQQEIDDAKVELKVKIDQLDAEIDDMTNTIRHLSESIKALNIASAFVAPITEVIREQQDNRAHKKEKSPYIIKRDDKAEGNSQPAADASTGDGWVGAMNSLDDQILEYQLSSANTSMEIASLEAQMQMWKRFMDKIVQLCFSTAFKVTEEVLQVKTDKKIDKLEIDYKSAKRDHTEAAFITTNGKDAFDYFESGKTDESARYRMIGELSKALQTMNSISDPIGSFKAAKNISIENWLKGRLIQHNSAQAANGAQDGDALFTDPSATSDEVHEDIVETKHYRRETIHEQRKIEKTINKIDSEIAELEKAKKKAEDAGDKKLAGLIAEQIKEKRAQQHELRIMNEDYKAVIKGQDQKLAALDRQLHKLRAEALQASSAEQVEKTQGPNKMPELVELYNKYFPKADLDPNKTQLTAQQLAELYFKLVDLAANATSPAKEALMADRRNVLMAIGNIKDEQLKADANKLIDEGIEARRKAAVQKKEDAVSAKNNEAVAAASPRNLLALFKGFLKPKENGNGGNNHENNTDATGPSSELAALMREPGSDA